MVAAAVSVAGDAGRAAASLTAASAGGSHADVGGCAKCMRPGESSVVGRRGGAGPSRELLALVKAELRAEYRQRITSDAQRACDEIDQLLVSALRHLPPHIRAMPAREAFRLAADGGGGGGGGGSPVKRAKRLDSQSPPRSGEAAPAAATAAAAAASGAPTDGATSAEAGAPSSCSAQSKRTRPTPLGRGGGGGGCDAASLGGPADEEGGSCVGSSTFSALPAAEREARLLEMEVRSKFINEFAQVLDVSSRRLDNMSADQRRNFMSRVANVSEVIFS